MRVEVWSDVVCPWCYIGKRRFESALERFDHHDDVWVRWRSFELDPDAPRQRDGSIVVHLARKYRVSPADAEAMVARTRSLAAAEGLDFDYDRAQPGNTFDAHRLLQLAADEGVQHAAAERLFAAYFTEGEPIGDPEALLRIVADAGIDKDTAAAVLAGDDYADRVRADEAQARTLGITAVPFFVADGAYAVAGAQPAEVFDELLRRAWADRAPSGDPA